MRTWEQRAVPRGGIGCARKLDPVGSNVVEHILIICILMNYMLNTRFRFGVERSGGSSKPQLLSAEAPKSRSQERCCIANRTILKHTKKLIHISNNT